MPSRVFIPISIDDYVQKHLVDNPDVDRADLIKRLRSALASARAGVRCQCGGPIWVIGSAEVGLSCFTCITGEAHPSDDYEIADALGVSMRSRRSSASIRRRQGQGDSL